MVFAEVLEAAGAPQSWVIVAIAVLAFYHFRSGIGFLSRIGTVAQIVAGVGVILAMAAAGLIPGVTLKVVIDPFLAMLDGMVRFVGGLLGALL